MKPYGRLKPQPGYPTHKGGDHKQKRGAWKSSKDYLDGCGGNHPGRPLEKAETQSLIKESKEEMSKFKYTKIPFSHKITLPPGRYYVGDLCYVFEDDEWDRMFQEIQIAQKDPHLSPGALQEGAVEVEGRYLWFHGTAYGDGLYPDQFGNKYAVDAGIIGLLPEELALHKTADEVNNLGHFHQFDSEVECSYHNGTFFIGHIEIETGDEDDEWNHYDVTGVGGGTF